MPLLPAKAQLLLGTGALLLLATGCWSSSSPAAAPGQTSKTSTAGATASATTARAAPSTTPAHVPPTTVASTTTLSPTTLPSTTLPTTTPSTTTLPTTTLTPTTVAPPTTAASPGATGTSLLRVPEGSVLMVGDSVTIDAAPYLQPAGVTVNGEVGRQFSEGIELVGNIAAAHQLPGTLVVALGTNGTVTADEITQMVHAAVGARHIVFITIDVPRSWEAGDNAVIEAAPARFPGLVTVANWNAVASAHPEWFTADQVHLQTPGAEALAAFVLAAVT